MTDIKAQLLQDMKDAMKSRDSIKLGVIRFLRSEIKNYEIDHGEQDDKGVEKIISSQFKKMKDAMNDFQKAGRQDLVNEEEAKIAVMQNYLPEQMSEDDLRAIVAQVVEHSNETNVGKLIGAVIKEVDGKADGGRISALVKETLNS